MGHRRLHFVFVVLLLVGTGCSSAMEVRLSGASDMNDGGRAAEVHVYELTNSDKFVNTPLSAFWQNPEGALGGELIAVHRRIVYPDEEKDLEFELSENARVVGIAANLRNPEGEGWRAHYRVDEIGDQMRIVVRSTRISVEAEDGLPFIGAVHRSR